MGVPAKEPVGDDVNPLGAENVPHVVLVDEMVDDANAQFLLGQQVEDGVDRLGIPPTGQRRDRLALDMTVYIALDGGDDDVFPAGVGAGVVPALDAALFDFRSDALAGLLIKKVSDRLLGPLGVDPRRQDVRQQRVARRVGVLVGREVDAPLAGRPV